MKDEIRERLNRVVVPVCVLVTVRCKSGCGGHLDSGHGMSLQVHSNYAEFFLAMLFCDAPLSLSLSHIHIPSFSLI